MKRKITLGLFGFGRVGEGLYVAIQKNKKTGISIKQIIISNINKKRSLSKEYFHSSPEIIFNDPEINVVVELTNNDKKAFEIVKQAMEKGKDVVSASKKMIAIHLKEIIELQEKHNVAFMYEASCGGSIPLIRNLEEYYNNNLLLSVNGILNGPSNYVLSKIFNDKMDYNIALKQAQALGFATNNPSSDMEGHNTLYSLIIAALHSFGCLIDPDTVFFYGITNLNQQDVKIAKQKGYKIKLVGEIRKIHKKHIRLFVAPRFVLSTEPMYNIDERYNAILIRGYFYHKQFMIAKNTGSPPIVSAVLSDIFALSYNYKYKYLKFKSGQGSKYGTNTSLKIYMRYEDEEDLALFQFQKIIEIFKGEELNYVIGIIQLNSLIDIQPQLDTKNIFLAYL